MEPLPTPPGSSSSPGRRDPAQTEYETKPPGAGGPKTRFPGEPPYPVPSPFETNPKTSRTAYTPPAPSAPSLAAASVPPYLRDSVPLFFQTNPNPAAHPKPRQPKPPIPGHLLRALLPTCLRASLLPNEPNPGVGTIARTALQPASLRPFVPVPILRANVLHLENPCERSYHPIGEAGVGKRGTCRGRLRRPFPGRDACNRTGCTRTLDRSCSAVPASE